MKIESDDLKKITIEDEQVSCKRLNLIRIRNLFVLMTKLEEKRRVLTSTITELA